MIRVMVASSLIMLVRVMLMMISRVLNDLRTHTMVQPTEVYLARTPRDFHPWTLREVGSTP